MRTLLDMLKPGHTCDEAIKLLDDLMSKDLNDVQNAVPHSSDPQFGNLMHVIIRKYDEMTASVTRKMLEVFADQKLVSGLRSEKYGIILASDPRSVRTAQLLYAELSDLRTFFLQLSNELRMQSAAYSRHQGTSLVLDANDLLHYQRFDKIPWAKIYGKPLCIVIPHVVVDEIDQKSYSQGDKISRRARGVYRLLEQMSDEVEAIGFATLGDGVRLELMADEPGHRRLPNNDNEIVARAAFLQQAVSPHEVVVVTRDIGMRARARAWKLQARKLPDDFLIPSESLSMKDLDAALSEIGPTESD